MLSFITIMSLHVISALQNSGGRRRNITELKAMTGFGHNGISTALRALKKGGWIETNSTNRYRLKVSLKGKTLYDLATVAEQEIRLGTWGYLTHWSEKTATLCPAVKDTDRELNERVITMLKEVRIEDLINAPM